MHNRSLIMVILMLTIGISAWWFTHSYKEQFYINAGSVPRHFESRLETLEPQESVVAIAIIGSGCAGLSAAIYGARLHYHTVVFEGKRPGGQLTSTTWVENWPGMDKILGTDIIMRLKHQAMLFGARILPDTIVSIDTSQWPFVLKTDDGITIYALSIILATGADPRLLEIPGEKEYFGKGVTTCAICDAPFHKDGTVVVVGGGDSAAEEAIQLAPYAKEITVLVRGESMRASAAMQQHLQEYANIKIQYNTKIQKIIGNGDHVTSVQVLYDNKQETILTEGVFLAIGHLPNSSLVKNALKLDDQNYVLLAPHTQQTSQLGIFAAGDVCDHRYRQAGVAAGDGIKAALDSAQFLREHGFNDSLAQKLKTHYFDPLLPQFKMQIPHIETLKDYEEFLKEHKDKVIVLDFYTQYCPTCLQMMPLVESVAAELHESLACAKIDALKAQEITTKFVVPTVPTLIVIKNNQIVARTKDIMTRQQLHKFLSQFI